MIQYKYIIKDPVGLHMRPAKKLAETVKYFHSKICIEYDNKVVKANSVLRVVTLGATHGKQITFTIDGEDEEQAFEQLKMFLDDSL